MFWDFKKEAADKEDYVKAKIDPCAHHFIKVATTYVDEPYPLKDMWERTVLYCPKCKTKTTQLPEEADLLLKCQKVDEEWWAQQKRENKSVKTEKLLNVINDLIADNDFNTDEHSKRSIEIDITNLCKELKVTTKELHENQLAR